VVGQAEVWSHVSERDRTTTKGDEDFMSSVVATRNVSRSYGRGEAAFTALDNINLSIVGGESVAIVGKSG
jgi:ABC-type bacteriocin/lantibiotic exporter with double-glycine peptidase domain